MGSTNPDKKRLGADIEDECKSIAWQVSTAAFCGIRMAVRQSTEQSCGPLTCDIQSMLW